MATSTNNQRDYATGPVYEKLPHTLLDAVGGGTPFTGHQKLGVIYQVDSCQIPTEFSGVDCSDSPGTPKEPNMDVLWRGADPFVVYSWLPCTYVGEPPAKLREDTRAAHETNVQKRVDEVFWTGGIGGDYQQRLSSDTEVTLESGGNTIVLQTAATIVSGGGVLDVATAVGTLEQEMAECYGGTPWLHVPRGFIAEMSDHHLLDEDLDSQGRLRTRSGSIVVAYSAPNTGPDGSLPGRNQFWIYATGSVKVWRGAQNFTAKDAAQALNRSINETVLILEERFVIGWDCCHFAALVTIAG